MRIANVAGRLALVDGDRALDVHAASGGRFAAEPQAVYERWEEFQAWTRGLGDWAADGGEGFEFEQLGSPAPSPRQVFAVGLNYRDHAAESGFEAPDGLPPVFTKFPTCVTGPYTDVALPEGGHTDWEVELVVVMGRRARTVNPAEAWQYVAGLTVGQDLSERIVQLAGPAPQFGLGKSFPGFAPVGPCLVTPDEFDDPDDLELSCTLNGEEMQKARTSALIFPVATLIARISAILPLLPGDLLFTGTPAGVGLGRDPQRWLAPGDELISTVEGIGELRQRFVS